jgi:dimethylargininase
VDADSFHGAAHIEVHPGELEAANVLVIGATVVVAASASRTRGSLEKLGYTTVTVDASELAKAEGGLTCCSLLVSENP